MGCKNRAIPFLIMHGRGDTMMKINGGYRHNGAHYLTVRDLVGSYAKRNGCGYPPRVTHIRGGERHVYPSARKELQLILEPRSGCFPGGLELPVAPAPLARLAS